MNDKIRVIKKYPNRRLYDTAISSYVTLEEIKTLVINHIKFRVIDTRTNEDVTNYILLQIISEQENRGTPLFTTEVLQNIIRFYGNSLQNMLSQYLEKGVSLFAEQQTNFQSSVKNLLDENTPLKFVADVAKYHLSLWQTTLEHFFNSTSGDGESPKKKTNP